MTALIVGGDYVDPLKREIRNGDGKRAAADPQHPGCTW